MGRGPMITRDQIKKQIEEELHRLPNSNYWVSRVRRVGVEKIVDEELLWNAADSIRGSRLNLSRWNGNAEFKDAIFRARQALDEAWEAVKKDLGYRGES